MKAPIVCVASLIDTGLDGLNLYSKVSPPPVPKGAVFPYITLQETASQEIESLEGRSFLLKTIIQVNCWDKSYVTSHALRASVKALLLPFNGPVLDVVIQGFNHVIDAELYDGARELHQLITRLQAFIEYDVLEEFQPLSSGELLDFPV